MSSSPRRVAFDVLRRIHADDAYSHIALDAELQNAQLAAADTGLATIIVYGVLAWQRALDRIIERSLRRKKLADLSPVLVEVLRVGVFQLRFLDRVPDHAAISETVELARSVNQPTGMVNAILRAIASSADEPWWGANRDRKPARYIGERWSLPNWIANRLVQHYGIDRAEQLAVAFNEAPPVWLRAFGSPDPIRAPRLDKSLRDRVERGELFVQDLGAQKIVHLCDPQPGSRVLDACAGLGTKSLHLADLGADVVAVDPATARLERLPTAAAAAGLQDRISIRPGELGDNLEPRAFDGVLVDAPCSGLGVIRRHPETRWRRREADITSLAKLQAELLDQAALCVKPGGWLVFSVCTWTREETTKQAERFAERNPEFVQTDQFETMPDQDDADGFYAARFVRDAEG